MQCSMCSSTIPASAKICPVCGAPQTIPSNVLATDTTLLHGKYRVQEVLGQGGFGITYKAVHQTLGATVAIKELFPENSRRNGKQVTPPSALKSSDWQALKDSFVQEAQTVARFNSPSIVKVMDIFEENGTAYLVMEFLEGYSLGKLIELQDKIPAMEVERIAKDVAGALKVVHRAGMLHRDIKPDNIYLEHSGRVVLIDFGSARAFASDKAQSYTRLVTPGYAPLEQYASQAKLGPYTDIYALGATLYHALTGQQPLDAVSRQSGQTLSPLPSNTPAHLRKTIEAAMTVEVAKRPQTAEEFLNMLGVSRTQIPPVPPQPVPQPGPTPPNNRKAVGCGCLPIVIVLLVLGIGLGYFAYQSGILQTLGITVPGLITDDQPLGNQNASGNSGSTVTDTANQNASGNTEDTSPNENSGNTAIGAANQEGSGSTTNTTNTETSGNTTDIILNENSGNTAIDAANQEGSGSTTNITNTEISGNSVSTASQNSTTAPSFDINVAATLYPPERKSIYAALERGDYGNTIQQADAWLKTRKTDALIRIARDNAALLQKNIDVTWLGVSVPTSGKNYQSGEAVLQGVYLAVSQHNAAEYTPKVAVEVFNDFYDKNAAQQVANKLSNASEAVAVVGPVSSAQGLSSAPIYQKAGMLQFLPTATDDSLVGISDHTFRMAPPNEQQGKALANLVSEQGSGKVALYYNPNDAYSNSLAVAFNTQADVIGLTVQSIQYSEGQVPENVLPETGTQAAVFASGYLDAANLAKALKASDMNVKMYTGHSAYSQELFAQAKDAVEGLTLITFYHHSYSGSSSIKFRQSFKSLYGGGLPNARSMQAYDSTRVLLSLMREAYKSNPTLTREAVYSQMQKFVQSGNTLSGVTSPIRFDQNNGIIGRPFIVLKVQNGNFVLQSTINTN